MPGPLSLRWRLMRSVAFAMVTAQLAAIGHLMGGGAAPDPAVLLVGAATIGAVATGLTRSKRSWAAIIGLLLTSQLAFHLLFSVDVHGMTAPAMSPIDPARMVSFHLVAAALSAGLLARGESALFGLFAVLHRYVLLVIQPIAIDVPLRWTAPVLRSGAPRPTGALLSSSPRRGPPGTR